MDIINLIRHEQPRKRNWIHCLRTTIRPTHNVAPTVMPARVCVDLASSTIGVHSFGDYANGNTPDLLSLYDQFAICFDVYGKPDEAWGWSGSTATRIDLEPGKPIALLCTCL